MEDNIVFTLKIENGDNDAVGEIVGIQSIKRINDIGIIPAVLEILDFMKEKLILNMDDDFINKKPMKIKK